MYPQNDYILNDHNGKEFKCHLKDVSKLSPEEFDKLKKQAIQALDGKLYVNNPHAIIFTMVAIYMKECYRENISKGQYKGNCNWLVYPTMRSTEFNVEEALQTNREDLLNPRYAKNYFIPGVINKAIKNRPNFTLSFFHCDDQLRRAAEQAPMIDWHGISKQQENSVILEEDACRGLLKLSSSKG